jgi:hypothetical protein
MADQQLTLEMQWTTNLVADEGEFLVKNEEKATRRV